MGTLPGVAPDPNVRLLVRPLTKSPSTTPGAEASEGLRSEGVAPRPATSPSLAGLTTLTDFVDAPGASAWPAEPGALDAAPSAAPSPRARRRGAPARRAFPMLVRGLGILLLGASLGRGARLLQDGAARESALVSATAAHAREAREKAIQAWRAVVAFWSD